jgi:hypothetical protein
LITLSIGAAHARFLPSDVVAVGVIEEDLACDQISLARLGLHDANKRKRQACRGGAFQENATVD